MVNIYCSIKVNIFVLTYLLTKHRYCDISSVQYRYRIEIETKASLM